MPTNSVKTTESTLPAQLVEGIYQFELKGERFVVDVRMTMQGQWPEKREVLMAHPLSGPPRFPWTVQELLEWGSKFKRLA